MNFYNNFKMIKTNIIIMNLVKVGPEFSEK